MSNRNFDASVITQRKANKAVAKNILSIFGEPYNFQPQTSNLSASVINEVALGNSQFVTRGPTCTTTDLGCPCIGEMIMIPTATPQPPIIPGGRALWATRIGGTGSEFNPSITTDSTGNIYISGQYGSNPLTINDASGVSGTTIQVSKFGDISNVGLTDIFLAKYDSLGKAKWATRIGGTGNDTFPSITTDSTGNVFISGQYGSNPLTINDASGVSGTTIQVSQYGTLSNVGSNDIFLTKYNSLGKVQWATRISGTGNDSNPSITTDSTGNVYISGQYGSNPLTINDASGVSGTTIQVSKFGDISNVGSDDIFLAKYNSLGKVQWATRISGTGSESFPSITTDSTGNVYIAGSYTSNPLTINDASGVSGTTIQVSKFGDISNAGSADIFLAKYNSLGKAQWATRIGSTGGDSNPSITTDSTGNVYIIGEYGSNPLTINDASGVSGTTIQLSKFGDISNVGSTNIFLAKYNPLGKAQWVTQIGSTGSDLNPSIATDSTGNVYISGQYGSNPLTINDASGVSGTTIQVSKFGDISNVGSSDIFLTKYNSLGKAQWATRIGGTGNETVPSITPDSTGSVYISGQYGSNPLTINDASGVSGTTIQVSKFGDISNVGSTDIFLAKYTQ